MNAQTLEALKASIAKWERNAEAKTPDDYKTGQDDCPLCKLFIAVSDLDMCVGCPVAEKTGEDGCSGTPYLRAWQARSKWSFEPKSTKHRAASHAAARDEVAFLKSLLPVQP